MKGLIKKLLREGLEESINLNLSKQIRRAQKGLNNTEFMDNLFGKNVYRLYYDLDTGKQITPTRKEPKIKFDVNLKDRLGNTISQMLKNNGFEVTDLDKNIATNTRNNQQIKISKVLGSLDKELLKQYSLYLDALTKKNQTKGKLYAVVSRHSHDIASMSSKPQIDSCESLKGYTDIKQTFMTKAMRGYDVDVEGSGQYIWNEIEGTSIVMYLIKEGDWNIEDPLARILGTNLCNRSDNQLYGKYDKKFKNFWVEWVGYYRTKILKKSEMEFDEDLFKKDADELIKLLSSFGRDNERRVRYLLRGIINNKRFDVFDTIFGETFGSDTEVKMHGHIIEYVLGELDDMFQPKMFKTFPPKTQSHIKEYLDEYLDEEFNSLKTPYLFITDKSERDYMLQPFIDDGMTVANGRLMNIVSVILRQPRKTYYKNLLKAYSNEKLNKLNKIKSVVESNWYSVLQSYNPNK
jgi:hypothetical protein